MTQKRTGAMIVAAPLRYKASRVAARGRLKFHRTLPMTAQMPCVSPCSNSTS